MRPERSVIQWTGLVAGPLLAAGCYAVLPREYADPSGDAIVFTAAGRATLALLVWMATWWLTEAIEIPATALLPIAVLPVLGAASIGEAATPYASPVIFLFLGGFLLALAMQRWELDRRIALITLRLVGDRPTNMVAGVMAATAVMSMFVSNTATAAVMLPIAISVVRLLEVVRPEHKTNFSLCMMLGIAYAASIGGVGTIIGTPPNGILVGYIRESYGVDVGFADWLPIGLPLVAVFLPVTWIMLTRVIYPVPASRLEGAGELIRQQHERLGPVSRGEWAVFIVFTITAVAWLTRSLLEKVIPGISDAGIAMTAAVALFVIPVDRRQRVFVLNWETAAKAPWGILILFGGGLSLAAAVDRHGVAAWIGSLVAGLGDAVPMILLVLVVAALVIFLTELTSNTATTATLVPILAALAPGLGVDPVLLIVPAALAASCAFMMPVATPPNAIVFGSGYVTIPQMCKAGLWLNIIGIVLITVLSLSIVTRVLVLGDPS